MVPTWMATPWKFFNSEFTPEKNDGLEDELAEFPFGAAGNFSGASC